MKRFAFTFVFIAAVGAFFTPEASLRSSDADKLFVIRTAPQTLGESERSSVGAVREAEITFDGATASRLRNDRLLIPVFDSKEFVAERTQSESRASDDLTWRGKISAGRNPADVVITYRKGYISGLIYTDSAVYEIVPRGEKHVLVELD